MPFLNEMSDILRAAGLDGSEVSSSSDDSKFGDAEAVFLVGQLLLRLVRDRGQIFLEIASSVKPRNFLQFDDIEIAMGWKSQEDVLAKREPEEIDQVLLRVARNFEQLESMLGSNQSLFTAKRVDRIAKERGLAFADRLREIAYKNGGQQGSE